MRCLFLNNVPQCFDIFLKSLFLFYNNFSMWQCFVDTNDSSCYRETLIYCFLRFPNFSNFTNLNLLSFVDSESPEFMLFFVNSMVMFSRLLCDKMNLSGSDDDNVWHREAHIYFFEPFSEFSKCSSFVLFIILWVNVVFFFDLSFLLSDFYFKLALSKTRTSLNQFKKKNEREQTNQRKNKLTNEETSKQSKQQGKKWR